MLSRSNAGTGIVLGHHSVKLVRVEPAGRERPRLTHWGVQEIDPAASPEAAHAKSLRTLLDGLKLKPRNLGRVATAISGRDVYLRQVTMPLLSEADLRRALPFEAKKHFPLDSLSNPVLDFQILGPTTAGNGNGNGGHLPVGEAEGTELQEVLLVAAPKRRRDEALKTLIGVGIDPETVDAEPLPTINAVLGAQPESAAAPVIVIGLGAKVSFLAAVDPDGGLYTRHLSFSGEELTTFIEEKLNFDRAAAEAMKKDLSGPESEQVTALLAGPIRDLVGEIGETVRFLSVRRRNPQPGRFYLTGGASLTAGLAGELSRGLGAEMSFADPFLGLDMPSDAAIGEADKVRLVGAVGLACAWGQGEV